MLRRILLLSLALPPLTGAAAGGRVGELDVRVGNNGAPCFTVSAREEERSGAPQFQSITVSEPGAYAPMWAMTMPRGRTFALAYYMCVPYGGRPPVLPQTRASALQRGRPYEVVVNALPARAGAPRQYRGRFCVQADGVALLAAGHACSR